MASQTIRVSGLKETVKAFNQLDRALTRELQKEMKKAADPVVTSGRSKISRYAGAKPGSIGPRASGASVFVTQRAKKVTGRRGDFGLLQQRRLEEALKENETEVLRGVEGALDRLTDSAGF